MRHGLWVYPSALASLTWRFIPLRAGTGDLMVTEVYETEVYETERKYEARPGAVVPPMTGLPRGRCGVRRGRTGARRRVLRHRRPAPGAGRRHAAPAARDLARITRRRRGARAPAVNMHHQARLKTT